MKTIYDNIASYEKSRELEAANICQIAYVGCYFYRKKNGTNHIPTHLFLEPLLYQLVSELPTNWAMIRPVTFCLNEDDEKMNVSYDGAIQIDGNTFAKDFVIAPSRKEYMYNAIDSVCDDCYTNKNGDLTDIGERVSLLLNWM